MRNSNTTYQGGCIDPAELMLHPDPTLGVAPVQFQVPNGYQNMERPVRVSANAADRPEGPQAFFARGVAGGSFDGAAAQARTAGAGYHLSHSHDFLGKPPAQLGTGGVYPPPELSRSATLNSAQGSPAEQGSWGGGWNYPEEWSSLTTFNSYGEQMAMFGASSEKPFLMASDPAEQTPTEPVVELAVEPAVEPPTDPEGTVEYWLSDLPAEIQAPVNDHLWEQPAQQQFLAYPPPPMAFYDFQGPPAPLLTVADEFVPEAIDPQEEPPAQLGNMASGWYSDLLAVRSVADEFVPEAIDPQAEPPPQLGNMADGWFSDLPAEQTVSSLQAVTAYPFDGDYLAKAFFTLENPEAKLTEEHVPAGKGAAPSFKFATKRDYTVGTGADGTKVLYRKDGEDAAVMRQVPSRDRIWAVLCGAHKDAHTGRHCGRDKTKENVERNYYGITKKMIDNFLDACPVCNSKRSERRAQLKARLQAKQRAVPEP